jgi:hypothetical protein
MPWMEAEEFCQAQGANLASITTEKQDQLAWSLLQNAGVNEVKGSWIGLNDAAKGGTRVWSDGEPLEYQNWGLTEPGTETQPIALREEKWADTDANRNLPFICSRPTAPSTASGGAMHGCTNGHWVQGTPHASLVLPPTVVSNQPRRHPAAVRSYLTCFEWL